MSGFGDKDIFQKIGDKVARLALGKYWSNDPPDLSAPGYLPLKLSKDGALNVDMQDQTTPPVDALFSQSISNFTISVDTIASGVEVGDLEYTFTATAAHGIISGNEILLLDVVGNWSFIAKVTNVAANVITVDSPIDHVFPAATTLGRIITSQMAVNGSVTPQIFSIRAGAIPTDFTRFILTITDNAAMDDGKFGGITPLPNGLVFRVVNSFQKTIFNFKTNGDIKQFCFDGSYTPSTLGPSGSESFSARITFGGQSKHGVVLRISGDDVLQWVVQDDLTDLISLKIAGEGHVSVP